MHRCRANQRKKRRREARVVAPDPSLVLHEGEQFGPLAREVRKALREYIDRCAKPETGVHINSPAVSVRVLPSLNVAGVDQSEGPQGHRGTPRVRQHQVVPDRRATQRRDARTRLGREVRNPRTCLLPENPPVPLMDHFEHDRRSARDRPPLVGAAPQTPPDRLRPIQVEPRACEDA